jgi:uncharacterized protein (DUF433 family)
MNLPDFLTRHKYGEIRLTGHRIGLFHLVEAFKEGSTVEGLHQAFPSLPLTLLRQAIAFYLEHKSEVDDYVAACRAEIDRQAAAPQPGPSLIELRARLAARRSTGTQ